VRPQTLSVPALYVVGSVLKGANKGTSCRFLWFGQRGFCIFPQNFWLMTSPLRGPGCRWRSVRQI